METLSLASHVWATDEGSWIFSDCINQRHAPLCLQALKREDPDNWKSSGVSAIVLLYLDVPLVAMQSTEKRGRSLFQSFDWYSYGVLDATPVTLRNEPERNMYNAGRLNLQPNLCCRASSLGNMSAGSRTGVIRCTDTVLSSTADG